MAASRLRQDLGLKRGQLDVLAGCPPCQSFSTLKTLNGGKKVRDKDSKDLLFEILRFVRALSPKAVMLRTSLDFRPIRESGFCSCPATTRLRLRAQSFECWRLRRSSTSQAHDSRRHQEKVRNPTFGSAWNVGLTVRDAIFSLPAPRNSADPLHNLKEHRSKAVRDLIAKNPKERWRPDAAF